MYLLLYTYFMALGHKKTSSRTRIQPASPPALPPRRPRCPNAQLLGRCRKRFSHPLVMRWLPQCPGSFSQRLVTPLLTLW